MEDDKAEMGQVITARVRRAYERFTCDDTARIPFALIGHILLITAVGTSIAINRMDVRAAGSMTLDTGITAPDSALLYAEADLARALNYAGMDALKKLGETPVIVPVNSSEYNTTGSVEEFNMNWAKAMMNRSLFLYLESNYMYDSFVYKGYTVNVKPPGHWSDFKLHRVRTKLNRPLEPPVLAPGDSGYDTYWLASVPMRVEVRSTDTGRVVMDRNITVSTLVTSRYPMLRDLTSEYGERINGTNAAMAEVTAIANAYTWARGYLQYYKTAPRNIVDNPGLESIVNGALLLDQGFVFNSVDPMSLVEYVARSRGTSAADAYTNTSLVNGSMKIDTRQEAFNSTGDPTNASKFYFAEKSRSYNASSIMDELNNGSGSQVANKINEIMTASYSAMMYTDVSRRQYDIEFGEHDGYPDDDGASAWKPASEPVLLNITNRSGYMFYGELWSIRWVRDHKWHYSYERCDTIDSKSVCKIVRVYTIVQDYQNENVTLRVFNSSSSDYTLHLNTAGTSNRTVNDVADAFYTKDVLVDFISNDTYIAIEPTDSNLEGTIAVYIGGTFNTGKMDVVKTYGLTGATLKWDTLDGVVRTSEGKWSAEVAQAWADEITRRINAEVSSNSSINFETYPVPSDMMRAVASDLINQIGTNESDYVDKGKYYGNGSYESAGIKTVSLVREWYVDEVKYRINKSYNDVADTIDSELDRNMSEDGAANAKSAARNGAKLMDSVIFPIGLTMRAYPVDSNGTAAEGLEAWSENVTIALDQEPDYLYMNQSNKTLITLGVRNINVFGPTGIPVLPTNPMVMFNAWMIEVQGKMNKFTVCDADNEVHPNPIFGHEAQVYVRREGEVLDPISGRRIGYNQPIKFGFTTGTFIAVPPGKPIGDTEKGIIETSPYFGEIK
ncbi:MAG TPA: hypothetical protein HA257_02515 [Candidatus Methanoperedenaceae archaeon]|nr:hypothetical protein [Candidatus Methanoperedenaceae archaeon]